jgi:hypothetical protein
MIEFSLSKLNLLIFVTAIAAIVIFFIATVNSNMKTRQSYELVYKVGKEIKTGIENESYCTVKFITIPKTIQTNSGSSDTFNMRYKLNISAYSQGSEDSKKVVLAVMDRKEKSKIYAAYDIDYNGSIALYESESCTSFPNCEINLSENYSVNYDPSKVDSIDTQLLFAKIISNGKPTVFLIPCLKKSGIYTCRNFLNNYNSGTALKTLIPCLDIVTDLVNYNESSSAISNSTNTQGQPQ